MTEEMKRFLEETLAGIKKEFAVVEITPRQFSRWGGDKEYAEVELLEAAEDSGIDTLDHDLDDIYSDVLFQKAVRWQAAYNMVA